MLHQVIILLELIIVCAVLLAVERISYVLIWRRPARFAEFVAKLPVATSPVDALRTLFVLFKCMQLGVFLAWFILLGGSWLPVPSAAGAILVLGLILILFGQVLNFSVFWRLGKVGVFYGNRLGHKVPWVTSFPFNVVSHPQYVGTLLSIWGLFLIMRYPHPDWLILPIIQTIYYLIAMRLERAA